MESLYPTPMFADLDNWNFDGLAGNAISNDDSWLSSFGSGPITDGAILAGVDPVLAPSSMTPEDGTFLDQILNLCQLQATQENGGMNQSTSSFGQQVQAHPQPSTTTLNATPTNRTDIPLLENRRVSIPTLGHFAAPAAPTRRRSRAGSIATLNRQAQWSAQSKPKSPTHDLTFGRRASITATHSRKRKHSVCDVPLRRTVASHTEPSHRPQAALRAPPPPPVVPTHNFEFPIPGRLSLSCDLLAFDLPPPEPHFELPAVTPAPPALSEASGKLPEKFEALPIDIQKIMIKPRMPPFVTCGWAGCTTRFPPDRTSVRDHLNKCHGGRPTSPHSHEAEDASEIRVKCEWGLCSQDVKWGGMSRHLLSHQCPGSGRCVLCGGSVGRSDMNRRHVAGCWKRFGTERVAKRLQEVGMLEMVLNAGVQTDGGERPKKKAKKAKA